MWDILEVTREGTNDVKRTRKHALIEEYEMFIMQKGEIIVDVQKRFTHIDNHLIGLGKTFEREELNTKILKCLDRSWQPKVTTISESKDLTSLITTSLFGKHKEQELEINKLNDQEHEEKHVRNIVLKAVGHKNCQESSKDNDGDTLSLLTRKFSKFLEKNNKNQSSNRYNNKKLNDFNTNKYTCFGCGEQEHIKAYCPNKESKEKGLSKKIEKKGKSKRAYIAWQNYDVSSLSEDE
ncbi:uncharacterized protein [Phaseolus vulgaris]|uniref:uncharacterized protein n=1 Tax=Phaseolus vulgaris TaxID=3885 RepID=UPI0035CB591C